jgi:hypothetical protein
MLVPFCAVVFMPLLLLWVRVDPEPPRAKRTDAIRRTVTRVLCGEMANTGA